jgi:hypothetical protein
MGVVMLRLKTAIKFFRGEVVEQETFFLLLKQLRHTEGVSAAFFETDDLLNIILVFPNIDKLKSDAKEFTVALEDDQTVTFEVIQTGYNAESILNLTPISLLLANSLTQSIDLTEEDDACVMRMIDRHHMRMLVMLSIGAEVATAFDAVAKYETQMCARLQEALETKSTDLLDLAAQSSTKPKFGNMNLDFSYDHSDETSLILTFNFNAEFAEIAKRLMPSCGDHLLIQKQILYLFADELLQRLQLTSATYALKLEIHEPSDSIHSCQIKLTTQPHFAEIDSGKFQSALGKTLQALQLDSCSSISSIYFSNMRPYRAYSQPAIYKLQDHNEYGVLPEFIALLVGRPMIFENALQGSIAQVSYTLREPIDPADMGTSLGEWPKVTLNKAPSLYGIFSNHYQYLATFLNHRSPLELGALCRGESVLTIIPDAEFGYNMQVETLAPEEGAYHQQQCTA